ncbi:MAG: hypothetical protein A3F13_05440 [Gammaproteobacteria bacterium RIFCSPHIGHO2_12_FULL_40_19]|nr:MAG: hypothetical protein A3F13_05440 [Gammaproteobacteria bacterium RIFCSPHIGHO2_12_FULL_40_19]
MNPSYPILQIAIKTPLRRSFDYLALSEINHYQIGQRVEIPFGRRSVIGVIVGLAEKSTFPVNKLKSVAALIDEAPLLDEKLLSLYRWASDYYQHPLGDVILGTLPKKIRDGHWIAMDDVSLELPVEKSLPDFELTQEQKHAIHQIAQTPHFQPFLLAGVTGSGKTEVYLRVIAAVLKKNKQALVLVPEISLTPQTVARFEARFSVPVLLMHSGLTDTKRYKAWLQSEKNAPCIVIGTRSAVFAPLKNCGVIIVDEEHDVSFKQHSGFRYSARDVAVMRAKLSDIPIVLGSATPALESIHNINLKKYELLTLSERAGNASLPTITVHNVCGEKLQQGLSPELIQVMRTHLNQGNQILLFLNRRGYAPVLMCHQCGWSASCPHCDARVTVHENPKRLLCHHCSHQSHFVRVCPSCKQSELMVLGLGTEQLEETVCALFPGKKICRVDRDNIKNFSDLEATLKKVHDKTVDILIGTQMLVKGHHFENVTLVVALDVDNALFSGDFRAIERLGQSLIQVAGRAGRASIVGEVFVQTHHPDHPLMQILFQSGYFAFANALLGERSQAQLPPFASMVLLRAEAKDKNRVLQFLMKAKNQMISVSGHVAVMGPFPSALEKKAGVYRMQLLMQSIHRGELKKVLFVFLNAIEAEKKTAGLKWILDVDPMEVV